MNILILNPILFSAENRIIPEVRTIKDTMIYSMCLGFVSNGHHVTLVASEEYRPTEKESYEIDIIFLKSRLTRLFFPSVLPFSPACYAFLKSNHQQFDLVLSSETFSFFSLFAAIICPSKTAIWHELTAHQKLFKKLPSKAWHHLVVPLFMRKVKCVIPRSNPAYMFIRRYMKNVSPIYVDHGIDIRKFEFSSNKKRQLISSSQLIYRKNVESIIKIYSRLLTIKGYEDIRLIIAGRGDRRQYLEDLVADLNLQDHVIFSGFLSQKELNYLIKDSLVFLINTRQDLNMVSIPESIASGTPVITNLKPALADYIAKEAIGIAKEDWDEFDLKELIDNNPFYVQNCLEQRDKLTNTYSARKITDIFTN